MEDSMSVVIPKKIDRKILDTIESSLTAFNLDDLLEASLSHLLCVDHVKEAEILLFNKREKLISVATASNRGSNSKKKQNVMAQSWLLDSTVEHTSRKIKFTGVSPVFSIPLLESQGLLGFLNIHLDKFRVVDKNELSNFYLFGVQIANKIKEIMLSNEINELKDHLQTVTLNNREIQQQVTSLSKELYAISAITTRINQSMDFDKSLRKTMATIRKFFLAPIIIVYIINSKTLKPELSAADCEEGIVEPAFLRKLENIYLKEIITVGKPFVKDYKPSNYEIHPMNTVEGELNTLVGIPLKSKDNIIGAMLLLHQSMEPFNRAGLRLLSGIANIMAMGIDNMNLFRESEQKKREAEFLVRSIARFNEGLDLKETLESVAEKGAEFVGPHCQVYLFSETKVPMIKAEYINRRGKGCIGSKSFKKITPKEMEQIFELMKSEKSPVLIKSINHLKRISRDLKLDMMKLNIHSLIAVPLYLRKKTLGLLLLIHGKGKRPFNSHDLSFAEALGSAAALAIENARTHTASLEMSEFLEKKISEKASQIQQIQERQKIRVENRRDIIFRVNKRNRFVFVNKAMEILTGCSREALYRGDIKAEEVVAPDDRKRVKDSFKKVLTGVFPTVKGLEYRHLNRKGEDHLISLTLYPEKDHQGRIIGIEGVGEDFTEKKRLESELEKAKDLALLGEFSSAVAHQIRNPLGNILMGSKLLQKELGIDEQSLRNSALKNQKYSRSIKGRRALSGIFENLTEGIHNLNQVVTELLEYTKTLKLSRSSQNIDIILRETLNRFRDLIKQNDIVVEEQHDPRLPSLSVDAILLGHVFQNVIHNAIQAMPSGGYLFLFSGFYLQKQGYAFISISDSGPGIRPSEAEKVFRPFYTTKEQGTGLGLSLAHRIIEAHKGMMWVCHNPCHHFVTKPVELIFGGCNPSYGGASIHIMLPIDRQTKRNLAYQDEYHKREDTRC
jgi:PAS domain S-box-containing protein